MQQKNNQLIIFLLIGLSILTYPFVQRAFFPPPPKKPGTEQEAAKEAVAQGKTSPEPAPAPKPKPKPEVHPKPPPQPPAKKVEHRDNIALGDDRFNVRAKLTTRGGGVQEVVLKNFQESDELGQPVVGPQGDKEPLHLLPAVPTNLSLGNGDYPSFLLYHYASAEGNPETLHPVETLGMIDWELASAPTNGPNDEEHVVAFTTEVPGQDVTITKTYHLKPNDYHIGLTLKFDRKPGKGEPLLFRYQLTGSHGLPIEGVWYTNVYRNAMIGRVDTKGEVSRDVQDAKTIGFQAGGRAIEKDENKYIQYAGIVTQYFASLIVVDNKSADGTPLDFEQRKVLAWARPTVESEPFPAKQFLNDLTMRAVAEPVKLEAGGSVEQRFLLYNGPVKVRLLGELEGGRAVDPSQVATYENDLHLNTLTDYGKLSFWSSVIIFFTNVMHGFLWWLYRIIPNYGLCIILLTVMVRAAMYPLSRRQAISSARMQEKMKELAPEVKKLEEKFKDDPMGLQQAKNELYMKRGVHVGAMMGSCWIVFLQMPIFLGLYYSLQESIHFRLAPFLWMKNLAAPDMLIKWGEHIPLLSRWEDLRSSWLYLGPFFNLLPIIAVAIMIVQQQYMAPPATDEQTAMQQKMMKYMMLFFGFMFYKVAAGLCLYFIASSLWGLTERKVFLKNKINLTPPPPKPSGGGMPARNRQRPLEGNDNGTLQKVRDLWDKVLKEAKKK